MFRAGIQLGLRSYFRGNPQHINIVPYSEVNLQTGKKDRYLVMYDTISGGTGYLSELFGNGREVEKINFSKVLEKA